MSLDFVIKRFQQHNVMNAIKNAPEIQGAFTEYQLQSIEKLIQAEIKKVINEIAPKKEVKIPFGKHKGKTLLEVYEFDPSYIAFLNKCEWVSKFDALHKELQLFKL